jgi:hypothetical protein
MRHQFIVLCIVASLTAAGRTRAEADDDGSALAGYLALTATPIGLVGPEPPEAEGLGRGPRLALRYGQIGSAFEEEDKVHAPALSVGLAAGRGRATVTLSRPIFCDNGDCEDSAWVVGLGWSGSLWRGRVEGARGPELSVGIAPSLGTYWAAEEGLDPELLSGHVGVPLAATLGRGTHWTFYAIPGAGWGQIRYDGDTLSGLRATVGGGLAIAPPGGVGFNLAVQKVLIEGGRTQLGVGISWQGR